MTTIKCRMGDSLLKIVRLLHFPVDTTSILQMSGKLKTGFPEGFYKPIILIKLNSGRPHPESPKTTFFYDHLAFAPHLAEHVDNYLTFVYPVHRRLLMRFQ